MRRFYEKLIKRKLDPINSGKGVIMIRLFKPGERVQLKSGGPVMEVMKYILEKQPLLGRVMSNTLVECSWYDLEEGRKTGIFHQNSLNKVRRASDPIATVLNKNNGVLPFPN